MILKTKKKTRSELTENVTWDQTRGSLFYKDVFDHVAALSVAAIVIKIEKLLVASVARQTKSTHSVDHLIWGIFYVFPHRSAFGLLTAKQDHNQQGKPWAEHLVCKFAHFLIIKNL
jgi:hypothetical protein